MNTEDDPPPLWLLSDPLEWARSHPTYFFSGGRISGEELARQLLDTAHALGSNSASIRSTNEWHVVGAKDDWFANARFKVPEDFAFAALTPCPELGQNCIRPEAVVAAFAKDVVVLSPAGWAVVKGTVDSTDPIHAFLADHSSWHRAVAFRRVEAFHRGTHC